MFLNKEINQKYINSMSKLIMIIKKMVKNENQKIIL